MANIQQKADLEEGEISDLEDGEIQDDEAPENPVKKPLISETPQVLQRRDFSRFENSNNTNLRGGNLGFFNPQRPNLPWRRESVPPSRFVEEENRFRERESNQNRMRTRPSFQHVNTPRHSNESRKKGIPRMSPNLQTPLHKSPIVPGRPKTFPSQQRQRPPSPKGQHDTDNIDDFDLLLERHKQIQLQLEKLEKEESAALLNNEDFIDDSFVDIPVDISVEDTFEKNTLTIQNTEQGNSGEGISGLKLDSKESKEEKLPKNFEPFRIKPLHPPVPTLKELSNREQSQDTNEELLNSLGSVKINEQTGDDRIISPTGKNFENSQNKNLLTAKKMRRRRRCKRQKDIRKANATVNNGNNNSKKSVLTDVPKLAMEQNTLDSRLMQLASSSNVLSNTADMEKKMRSSAEQQKKRRERLKQWQLSRKQDSKNEMRSGKGRGVNSEKHTSTGRRSTADGKDFELDDYLEAPMDVESDTPDGPVAPLIEETGGDFPPPPPPPPAKDQELSTLHQQKQMIHVSPNIHGFYPPGQILYSDWPSSYSTASINKDSIPFQFQFNFKDYDVKPHSGQEAELSPSLQESNIEGQATPTVAQSEDDDDEAALLREILLKSVAEKRAAKSTDSKDAKSQSAPVTPSPGTPTRQSSKPPTPGEKTATLSVTDQQPAVQQTKTIRKVSIQPPQHDPVVIQLGQDSESDYSDEEVHDHQQRGGFFGSLDMMIKQARQSVENSRPKPECKGEEADKMIVPKTPDALEHLPEERRAEYKRLKEQLAQHEVRKRQPLSDISQDKEAKSESETGEEKMDSTEESRELLELKEKVKIHEEKLTKHRKSLSEDQDMLSKMTSLLSEKTILLEVQETRVSKLKKQLETAQKAMLNNRLVIKKLHEKALKVKDRVSKKITISRNIEEDLLRVKSMVSAMRKDPSFYTGSDSNENKDTTRPTQQLKETTADRVEGSLKRSLDDTSIGNLKKLKLETHSQSAKASPRKHLIAERIAQEKARLKRLEQDLAERLSHFTKSPSKIQPTESNPQTQTAVERLVEKESDFVNSKNDGTACEPAEERPQKTDSKDGHEHPTDVQMKDMACKENENTLEFNIDDKQLDYIKKLQVEKEKKGPSFPKSSADLPQSVHKRTAMCIWLESNPAVLPVLDVQPGNFDWFGASGKSKENEETEEKEELEDNSRLSVGIYESILLYFRSYRLSRYFRTKAGLSLSSLTFTNKLNPWKSLCRYELKGACNDEECQYQHQRDYTPNDIEAMRDLAAYSIKNSEKLSHSAAEKKINSIVEKFTKKYKDKISMDQLFVLLVNSFKKDVKKAGPFNICVSLNPAVLRRHQQPAVTEECTTTVDRGRGVVFAKRDEKKVKTGNDVPGIECQEIRYFSEVYNNIKTLTEAVEESPSDVTLWIKLSRLQLNQKIEDTEGSVEEQNIGLMQSLNSLSRGLEANPNSEELWLEYLKLFSLQGHPDEHKELCEQAIGFVPTYSIWWHYLDSVNTYNDKRTICIRLINHLAKQEQDQMDDLHSHRLLESLLYLVQLELYTGRHKLALLAFQSAIGKRRSISNDDSSIPKLSSKISAQDLCLAWLGYIHVLEFHRLPASWFDPKCGRPSRMVAKDAFVFPWQPGGSTQTSSERILGMFHEALRACTLRNKSSNKVSLCLPLYQNLLALERAHGRLDSAKGICRRLLQGAIGQVELWQCLAALEESTGNPKQALVVLNEALKKCGNDWELTYTAARIYLEQGEPSNAIQVLVCSVKSRFLDPSSTEDDPRSLACTESSPADPVLLYRKLLLQPLPYDCKTPSLMRGVDQKPSGRNELFLWLSYCLLLELSPSISPLCLQYNLSAESAYETAVHTIMNRSNVQTVWLEFLFYKTSRVLPSNTSNGVASLKPLDDLVNRCLTSVSASRTLPYSTSQSWLDYSFYNQVINLYLGCLPQSLWSAVYTKYLKLYPSNLHLAIRACEHEVRLGCIDQAVKIATIFLSENPLSITMWKILISLNLQRNHTKEAHKLYQQSTDVLPFAATLWKDFIMFEIVQNDDKSSIREIIKECENIGVDIQEYLNTLQGK